MSCKILLFRIEGKILQDDEKKWENQAEKTDLEQIILL